MNTVRNAMEHIDPHIPHQPITLTPVGGNAWRVIGVRVHHRLRPGEVIVIVDDGQHPDHFWRGQVCGALTATGVHWARSSQGFLGADAREAVARSVTTVEDIVGFLTWGMTMQRRALEYGGVDLLTSETSRDPDALEKLELVLAAYTLPSCEERTVALALLADGSFTGTPTALLDAVTGSCTAPALP